MSVTTSKAWRFYRKTNAEDVEIRPGQMYQRFIVREAIYRQPYFVSCGDVRGMYLCVYYDTLKIGNIFCVGATIG